MSKSLTFDLTPNQAAMIKAVLYFDVFKYPLKKSELYENSAVTISQEDFNCELNALLENGLLIEVNGFIMNVERSYADVERRIKGNENADYIMATANKYSMKIASFPFVEGVCLSGSLSKNYFDENADIDFFIITKPNRLWICRTLLILRYKLLPKKKKKFWCVNYFISSDNLKIPDVNTFTGTELAHLLPMVNFSAYQKVMEQNAWYRDAFPNKQLPEKEFCIGFKKGVFQSFIENTLTGKAGDLLDNLLLKYTLNHWRKKYPEMNEENFELQFRSRKDVCKRHTNGFQNKILIQWQLKTKAFDEQFFTTLTALNS